MRAWARLVAVFGLSALGVRPCAAQDASGPQQTNPGLSFLDVDLSPSADAVSPLTGTALDFSAATLQSMDGPGGLLVPPGPVFGDDVPPQAVSGAQAGQLKNYGRQVGQDWLKDTLGVDLTGMRIVWDPKTWTFVTQGSLTGRGRSSGGDSAQGVSPGAESSEASRGVSVQLVQTDGLNRLGQGVVPYGVQVKGVFKPVQSLKSISTSLNIPLSPFDEWRADASLPMDWAADAPWWWRGLGLGNSLSLHSGINSRLGFNQVETGMRTQWTPGFWGSWDLDYAWDLRYGEGSAGDSSNWLKVSKEF